MNNAEDNPAASGGGGARRPRIEVLRGGPAAAAAPSAAPAAGETRAHVFGGRAPAEPPVIPPAPSAASRGPEYAQPVERRRGGGLLRSPAMLLAMLALAVLIGAIWYASLEREPDVVFDVPADPVRTETTQPRADAQTSDYEAAPEPEAGAAPPAVQAAPPAPAPAQRPEAADAGTVAPPVAQPPAPMQDTAPVEDSAPAGGAGAVATVRAFYSALSAGDGGAAAQWVVPSKRRSGPLSAAALTRYYSSFRRPLRVRRVDPVDANTVRVVYDYVLADGRLCRGSAAVDVDRSGDRGLVRGIRTQGPC